MYKKRKQIKNYRKKDELILKWKREKNVLTI